MFETFVLAVALAAPAAPAPAPTATNATPVQAETAPAPPPAALAPVPMQEQGLDKIATLAIPAAWDFAKYPMPMKGASNVRVTTPGLRMAITGIPKPKDADHDQDLALAKFGIVVSEEEKLKYDVAQSAMQYMLAGGRDANPGAEMIFRGEGFLGGLATLAAPTGEAVMTAFPPDKHACVTTAIIRTERVVYVATIGSGSCTGEDHLRAVESLRAIRVKAP